MYNITTFLSPDKTILRSIGWSDVWLLGWNQEGQKQKRGGIGLHRFPVRFKIITNV